MNKIWSFLIIFSICISFLENKPNFIMLNIKQTTDQTLKIILSLVGVMCFWNGIFKILKNTSLINKIARLFYPIINLICGKNENIPEEIKEDMILNISANFIGVGNAATMSGVKVMQALDKINNDEYPSIVMKRFVLINTASIQFLPTTILTLRYTYGSQNASVIIVFVWLISFVSLFVGMLLINLIKEIKYDDI